MGSHVVRHAGTSLAPGRLEDLPEPTWRSLLQRGLPQFVGEAVAPVLVFYAVWKAWGLAPAVAASTVVYLMLASWVLRRGHDLTLIAVGVAFVVIQALVGLASHSATVYLAQPVVLSALWGLAFFVSIAIGRPLVGVFAGVWYPFRPGSGPARTTDGSSPCSRSSGVSCASPGPGSGCGRCSTPGSAVSWSSRSRPARPCSPR